MCLVPPTFFLLGGGQVPPQQRGNPQLPCQCRGFPSSCSVPPNEKRSSSIFGQTRQKQPEDRKSGFSFRRSSSSQRPRPSVRSPLYSTPGFHMQRAGGPTDGRRDGWSDRKQVPPSPSPSLPLSESPLRQRPAAGRLYPSRS